MKELIDKQQKEIHNMKKLLKRFKDYNDEDEDEDEEEEDEEPLTKDRSKLVELGGRKFLGISKFKGNITVSIREFYEKDGELLPGKKGINLKLNEYKKLKKGLNKIDKKLE